MNIVQIGCNNGKDHVLEYVKTRTDISLLLLIDASIESIKKCKETYSNFKNCTFLHSAIVPDNSGFVNIYFPTNDEQSGHSSLSFDHVTRHNHKSVSTLRVPSININELLERYKPIDRLYIDTEGLDAILVNSIDFSKYKIPYIYFEFVHSDGAFNVGLNFEKAKAILLNNGYKLKIININIEASLT